MYRSSKCVLSLVAVLALAAVGTASASFTDSFATPHNYLTGGLGSYAGVLGTFDVLNADVNHPGALFMQTTGAAWDPGPGPMLYVKVTGDFVATVKVVDFAGTLAAPVYHNDCGIVARDPASAVGTENWVSMNYFPTWTAFVARNTTNSNRLEVGQTTGTWLGSDTFAIAAKYPYIQLERKGNNFYFRISSDGVSFIPLTDPAYLGVYDGSQKALVMSRPDLPATLQVGLANCTYDVTTGYAAFDDFSVVTPTKPAPVIEFVNEYIDLDANGVRDDQGYIDLLKAQGYTVNVRSDPCSTTYWKNPLNDTKVGYLNAADLVIVSRAVNSGNYSTAPDPNLWNGVKKPMILVSPPVTGNNRWKLLNNSTQTNLAAPTMQVLVPTHPIFAGVDLDPNNQVKIIDAAVGNRPSGTGNIGMTTVLAATSAGNGKLLATVAGANAYVWVAEWDANATTPYYTGAAQYAGGHRLTFFSGTQNNNTAGAVTPFIGQGCLNLNTVGQRMFLNAVRYMLGIQASSVAVTNASFETPQSKQQCWDGGTNAKGTFVDVPGWSSDTMAQDSGIEGPNAWPGDTDGVMAGYLMGSDPSAWNVTSYAIQTGDAFVLKVDSRDNWTDASVIGGGKLQMTLFCMSAGARVPLVTKIIPLTTTWATFQLAFDASESPACIGNPIGIELMNAVPTNNSWIGMDNVRLLNLAGK